VDRRSKVLKAPEIWNQAVHIGNQDKVGLRDHIVRPALAIEGCHQRGRHPFSTDNTTQLVTSLFRADR
jgi:hypothetical protein